MLIIDLNFDDVYDVHVHSSDLKTFSFESPLLTGGTTVISVLIQPARNLFLQEVLNLSFGPENESEIDDFARVEHLNYSKVFSTVLFCGLTYLRANQEKYLGVDGSDFRRAYLYYRTMQRNYQYLTNYFRLYGVKYYVRVLRGKDKNDMMQIDPNEFYAVPYQI